MRALRVACLIPKASRGLSLASRQTLTDIANFCRELGFEVFKLDFIDAFSFVPLVLISRRFDFLIVSYPAVGNPIHNYRSNWRDSFSAIVKEVKNLFLIFIEKLSPTILYIYDLPIEQNISAGFFERDTKEARRREYRLFSNACFLLVFNDAMGEHVHRLYKIDKFKIAPFGILDYGSNIQTWLNLDKYGELNVEKINVVYSANFANKAHQDIISKLPEARRLNYIILGPNFDETSLQRYKKLNIIYRGCLFGQNYITFLINKAHFGLVYKLSQYYEFGATSKFSSYMVAGVPVLVQEDYHYLANIVKRYNIGIVFKKLEDIPDILESLDTKMMRDLAINAYALGRKLKSGYFFKSVITKVLGLKSIG
jgi:hypothetical protein